MVCEASFPAFPDDVPLLRTLSSMLDGIWGLLKGTSLRVMYEYLEPLKHQGPKAPNKSIKILQTMVSGISFVLGRRTRT